MSKLHELLAAEQTVVKASATLLAETAMKFSKHTEFFTGSVRTMESTGSTPADVAAEKAARVEKALPTTVPDTLAYVWPFFSKALDLRLRKHATNQAAKSDLVLDGNVLMKDVPVDFLLDLEKELPQLRALFLGMPTLDPSVDWVKERDGVWKTREPRVTAKTEKIMYPVVLSPATAQHPAQVKEATKDVMVGTFHDTVTSGRATTQQKADVLDLCDRLIVAAKQARMRANSVEVVTPATRASQITDLFAAIFAK